MARTTHARAKQTERSLGIANLMLAGTMIGARQPAARGHRETVCANLMPTDTRCSQAQRENKMKKKKRKKHGCPALPRSKTPPPPHVLHR